VILGGTRHASSFDAQRAIAVERSTRGVSFVLGQSAAGDAFASLLIAEGSVTGTIVVAFAPLYARR